MTPFGTLPDGRAVHALDLSAGDLTVRLLTLGATLNDVRLAGVPHSLTLRTDDPADYLGPMLYFGGIVGPVANRIRNAQARIGSFVHNFEPNQSGRHILHSASAGTHLKIWTVTDHTPTAPPSPSPSPTAKAVSPATAPFPPASRSAPPPPCASTSP